jgi:hypothetical protein
VERIEKQTFHPSSGRAHGVQAGGQDRGIVPKERVARAKECRKIRKDLVGQPARGAIDHEEPGPVAPGRGLLRHQAGRERVIEQVGCGRRRH